MCLDGNNNELYFGVSQATKVSLSRRKNQEVE
jgi:hypothetical protein